MHITTARVYDLVHGRVDPGTATVALVDRLWPRGISKTDLAHDEWEKEAAPSTDLRREFHDGELDFDAFAERYRHELATGEQSEAVDRLAELAREGPLILAYAAKDTDHNHAEVLAGVVRDRA